MDTGSTAILSMTANSLSYGSSLTIKHLQVILRIAAVIIVDIKK